MVVEVAVHPPATSAMRIWSAAVGRITNRPRLEGGNILTASTLRALAGEIDQRLLEQAGESTLAQLLEEVDQLSDHEAQTLAEEETRAVSSEPARDR